MYVEVYEVHLPHEIRVVGWELGAGDYLEARRLADLTGGELVVRLDLAPDIEPIVGRAVENITPKGAIL